MMCLKGETQLDAALLMSKKQTRSNSTDQLDRPEAKSLQP